MPGLGSGEGGFQILRKIFETFLPVTVYLSGHHCITTNIMKLASFLLILTSCAALAATEEQINKTIKVASGGTLAVDVAFGSIEVTTNATDEVTVDVWRKVSRRSKADEEKFMREHPVEIIQDGSSVTIRFDYKDQWRGWWTVNRNEAKFIIRVPAKFHAKLDTAGGPISVSDITGIVQADTSGGGLKFTRVHGP